MLRRLMTQLAADCALLEELRVMDYSLLLGVHSRSTGWMSSPHATDRVRPPLLMHNSAVPDPPCLDWSFRFLQWIRSQGARHRHSCVGACLCDSFQGVVQARNQLMSTLRLGDAGLTSQQNLMSH